MDHVRWLGEPTLHRPTVLAAFTGWNDAGDSASNTIRHLIECWHAAPLAEVDPEEFTDFATVRPHVRLDAQLNRSIVWPTVGMWSASTPGGDVILVLGPEPALRWRLFGEQVLGVAQRFQASLLITVGALLADVPHSRPVQLIGTATDDHIISRYDLQRSRYEGPTGIVGVLHDTATRQDLASASLWAAVPAYASQVPSPKATLALVERACDMVGAPAPIGSLRADAAEYETRVSGLIDDDDLVGYVARLEAMSDDGLLLEEDEDSDDGANLLGSDGPDSSSCTDPELKTTFEQDLDSDELIDELERFLREQGPER